MTLLCWLALFTGFVVGVGVSLVLWAACALGSQVDDRLGMDEE